MRNKVNLYIAGQLADISSDALVLMNYRAEDLQNPAIVKNSYSQSLTLLGSPQNNTIFGHAVRADHRSGEGGGVGVQFSALKKTPFQIIGEDGQLLESGYIKLDSIERKADAVNYKITLFGGLGAFLYGLMYDAEGNKRSLADLDYGTSLDFVINRDSVRDAWRQLNGVHSADRWNVINFAPAYNGQPAGGFQSNKAFVSVECAGVQSDDSATGATAKRGHVLANLTQNYDEWQTKDLRSYLQRPVIKVGAVIDAICNTLNNGGYNVQRDSLFFNNNNPYYRDAWVTLPMLADLQTKPVSGEGESALSAASVALNTDEYINIPIAGDTAISTEYLATVTITPQMRLSASYTGDLFAAWERNDSPSGRIANRYGCLYQLLAYDAAGRVVGGSPVQMVTTNSRLINGSMTFPKAYTPAEFVRLWNNDNSIPIPDYVPAWADAGYSATAVAGDAYHFAGGAVGNLQTAGADVTLTLTLSARGVSRLALRVTTLGATQTTDSYLFRLNTSQVIDSSNTTQTFSSLGSGASVLGYKYESSGVVRSGTLITQRHLLGGTSSPADYLLSYVKMFGLQLHYDGRTKTVSILTRNTFYDDTTPIDLTEVIDRNTINVTPYILEHRWYEFGNEAAKGAFIDYYDSISNTAYGAQRVNTGYDFNADTKKILDGVIYRTAAETLAQGKYYANIKAQGKQYPTPFLDGGSYALWKANGEMVSFDVVQPGDTASVEYINQQHSGYDYQYLSKVQLCSSEGKPTDGENILLLLDYMNGTAYYRDYSLSDDNSLMTLYNGGEACWLLGQSALAENADYCIGASLQIPVFRRYKTVREGDLRRATYSLDMGTPRELGVYSIMLDDSACIYAKAWRRYITDRYDADSRVMSCKANIRALGQITSELLRKFYYYDGALWVMNAIKDYSLCTEDTTQIELVKVTNVNNYASGQNFLLPVLAVQEEYTAPRLGETATFAINAFLIDAATLKVTAPEWVTASISGTTLKLITGNNPTTAERSGIVIISGTSVEGHTLTAQMRVQQIGAYMLSVTPTRQTVGSRDFDVVRYNISYEGTDTLKVGSDAAWLDVAVVQNKYIDASVNQSNNTGANRTATITVTGLGVTASVFFVQRQGYSVNDYNPTLQYNSMQIFARTQTNPNSFSVVGAREVLAIEQLNLMVTLYVPDGAQRPTEMFCTIAKGSNAGEVYSMSYDDSPAPYFFRYRVEGIPLNKIFNNTDDSRLSLVANGETLGNNIMTIDFQEQQ